LSPPKIGKNRTKLSEVGEETQETAIYTHNIHTHIMSPQQQLYMSERAKRPRRKHKNSKLGEWNRM
jgi:hypothetical protein